MKSRWLALDPEVWNKPRKEFIRGVMVDVYASPQDVPEAVHGFYDDAVGKFAIEFRYPTGEEPKTSIDHDENVTLSVGKNSERLYRITINVKRLKAQAVGVQMYVQTAIAKEARSAIDRLVSERKHALREGNYRIAERFIERHQKDLLEAVPG